MRDPRFRTALQGAVCQTIAWERKQGKDAEEGVGGRCLKKKRRKRHGRLCVCRSVLLKRMCHVMAALAVFVFFCWLCRNGSPTVPPLPPLWKTAGGRGAVPHPSAAAASPALPRTRRAPPTECVCSPHKSLCHSLCLSIPLPRLFQCLCTPVHALLNTALKMPLVKSVAHVRPSPLSVVFNRWQRDISCLFLIFKFRSGSKQTSNVFIISCVIK